MHKYIIKWFTKKVSTKQSCPLIMLIRVVKTWTIIYHIQTLPRATGDLNRGNKNKIQIKTQIKCECTNCYKQPLKFNKFREKFIILHKDYPTLIFCNFYDKTSTVR